MTRMSGLALAVSAIALAPAAGAADVGLTRAPTAAAFEAAFCAADRSSAHIFVVPLGIFSDGGELACAHGTATTRMVEPEDDRGHVVMNIDPVAGVADSFDCDGKADIGMAVVALNCLPANAETVDHRKP